MQDHGPLTEAENAFGGGIPTAGPPMAEEKEDVRKKEEEAAKKAIDEEKAYLEAMRKQNGTEEGYQRWKDARESHEAGERPNAADRPMTLMEELLIKKGLIGIGGKIGGMFGRVATSMLLEPIELNEEEDTPEGYERGEKKRAVQKEKARLEAEEEIRRIQKAREPWDRARENQDPSELRKKAMQEDRARAAQKRKTARQKNIAQ